MPSENSGGIVLKFGAVSKIFDNKTPALSERGNFLFYAVQICSADTS